MAMDKIPVVNMYADDIKQGKYDNVSSIIQIKKATHAYIMHVSRSGDTDTYYIYTQHNNDTLNILWYGYISNASPYKEYLLPYQHTQRRTTNKPYINFKLRGSGYSKMGDIAHMLKDINPNILVYSLGGYYPCSVSANA